MFKNENSDSLDFDTNVILNPNVNNNNNRKRSARRFLEETENKMSKPISVGNKFQFNNEGFSNISSMPFQQPIIMKNDFNIRRNMGGSVGNNNNNNYNNNNNSDLFNNNNSGMMIGDNFNRRENNSTNNNNHNNNGILFGMQSRRGHINNNQAKNFEFKI
jgi:hypothetical protein